LEKSKAPLQEVQTSQFIQLGYYAELNGQTTSTRRQRNNQGEEKRCDQE
jgi:hypothetical protein